MQTFPNIYKILLAFANSILLTFSYQIDNSLTYSTSIPCYSGQYRFSNMARQRTN